MVDLPRHSRRSFAASTTTTTTTTAAHRTSATSATAGKELREVMMCVCGRQLPEQRISKHQGQHILVGYTNTRNDV